MSGRKEVDNKMARRHDLILVFDETYEHFVYGPEGHVSAAR